MAITSTQSYSSGAPVPKYQNWRQSGIPEFHYKPLEVNLTGVPNEWRSMVRQRCIEDYGKSLETYDQAIGDVALRYIYEDGDPSTQRPGPLFTLSLKLSLRYFDLYTIHALYENSKGIPLIPADAGQLKRQGFTSNEILRMQDSCKELMKIIVELKKSLSTTEFKAFFEILSNPEKRKNYLTSKAPLKCIVEAIQKYEVLKEKELIDRACFMMFRFGHDSVQNVVHQINAVANMKLKKTASIRERILMELRHRVCGDGSTLDGASGSLGSNPLAYLNLILYGEPGHPEAEFRNRMYFVYMNNHFTNEFMQNKALGIFATEYLKNEELDWQIDPQFVQAMNAREPKFLPPVFRYGNHAALNSAFREYQSFHKGQPRPLLKEIMKKEPKGGVKYSLSRRELMNQIGDFREQAIPPFLKLRRWSGGEAFRCVDRKHIEDSQKKAKEYLSMNEEIRVPFVSGISGTYDQMATMGGFVGVTLTEEELQTLKMTMIAFMVPAKDHSIHEILQSACSFGLPYIPGPGFERFIYPMGGDRFLKQIETEQEKRGRKSPAHYLTVEHVRQFAMFRAPLAIQSDALVKKMNESMKLLAATPVSSLANAVKQCVDAYEFGKNSQDDFHLNNLVLAFHKLAEQIDKAECLHQKVAALSNFLDLIDEGNLSKNLTSSIREKGLEVWNVYQTKYVDIDDRITAIRWFKENKANAAAKRFITQDHLFPLIQGFAKVFDHSLISYILFNKSSKIRPTFELLDFLEEKKYMYQPMNLYEQVRQKILGELFDLADQEILKQARVHSDAFLDWCHLKNREDLFEILLKEKLVDHSIPALFSAIHFLEKCPFADSENKIQEIFKILMKKPLSPDMIKCLVERNGKPISHKEQQLMTKLQTRLPDLNKALISYELLRRKTEKLDLTRFQEKEIVSNGQVFKVYDTSRTEFRYIVHSAELNEVHIEATKKQRMRSGFLCTSLISNEVPYFYRQASQYAMVLAVDPKTIVATTRQDAFTPYLDQEEALKHYNFVQRLQILTAYIDRLYRESGIQGNHPTDDLQRFNRLKSMRNPSAEAEKIAEEIRDKFTSKFIETDQNLFLLYKGLGIAMKKIDALLDYAENHPLQVTVAELEGYKELIMKTKLSHVHPIQGANELLLQTPFQEEYTDNCDGKRPYNEIDLNLQTSTGKDPIQVKAILIDKKAFDATPEQFFAVLQNAQENRIPILLKKDPRSNDPPKYIPKSFIDPDLVDLISLTPIS